MTKLSRREILKLLGSASAATLLASCAPKQTEAPAADPTATPVPTEAPTKAPWSGSKSSETS